jgi:hypothetical protein
MLIKSVQQSSEETNNQQCRSSGGHWLASHRGDPGSSREHVNWDLWWTKRHWNRFSPSTSVSPATHSTDCSTLVIMHKQGLVQ